MRSRRGNGPLKVWDENTEHCDDEGEWHTVRKRGAIGLALVHAASSGVTSTRNAYSCLSGALNSNLIPGENVAPPSGNDYEGCLVGQWFLDEIYTDARGHHSFVTGDVTYCSSARPVGITPYAGNQDVHYGAVNEWPPSRRAKDNRATVKPFETVNTTRAAPMLARLAESKSVFLGVQEHHVPEGGLSNMAGKVRNVGYKFCACGAVRTGNSDSGTSGGAAVCVKASYGVQALHGISDPEQPWTVVPGRAAGVKVLGMIKGGIVVISLYLHTGEPPNSVENWAILTRVAEILNDCRLPFIICGDFQCTPSELAATSWLQIVRGSVCASGEATCITHKSAREIDFFVLSYGLETVITIPQIVPFSSVSTHQPVQAAMSGNPRALTVKAFSTPKSFPRRNPYGPHRQPRRWEPFVPADGASTGDKMEQLAGYWIANAELDLCLQFDYVDDRSGAPLDEFLGRGSRPKIANVVPLAHPTASNMHCDVRCSFWQSVSNRVADVHRWLRDYRSGTDQDGNVLERNSIWQQYGFTRHVVGTVQKLVSRFRTPPKTILRLDSDLLDVWKLRALQLTTVLQTILFGGNVIGTEVVSEWGKHLDSHVISIQKQISSSRAAEFGQWLDDQLAAGAGGIHAATKETVGCFPDQVIEVVPGEHAAQTIVDLEVIKWAQPGIWRAWPTEAASNDDFDVNAWFDRQDDFPPLRGVPPPDEIRTVSGTFPWKTSVGSDGIHPRMIQCLGDTALKYLGLLFISAEAVAKLPELFRVISLFTRPKKSGYRVVGNLPTFYRIYARTRLTTVRDWEKEHPSDLFWASAGKGADVAVHAAATAADLACARGLHAAAALVDIFKCFEVLDHNVIIRKCKIIGFPMDVLAIALSMYSSARYLILNGAMGGPAYTHKGITAGCGFACFILRATMQADIVIFYNQHCKPFGTILQIFVDDLMLLQTGTLKEIPHKMAVTTSGLIQVLDALNMPAAMDKRIIVAAPALGRDIMRRLPGLSFKHKLIADQLGVDFAPGRRAGNAARDKRARIFGARIGKIRTFSRRRAAVGIRLAATAGVPTLAYSGMILGTSGSRLSWHQTLLYRTLTASNTQRSRHLALSVAGIMVEPAYGANTAPLLQWARTVYRSLFDLTALRHAMHFYQLRMAKSRHPWAAVTGTITAVLATLRRIGWTIVGAHLLKDAHGCYHDVRVIPIRSLKKLIDDATNCWLWRKHTKGTPCEQAFADGASSDIVRGLVDRSSSLDKEHRHALHSASTGGQWTQTRHVHAEHDISDLCQLCLTAPGTEWHRAYDCPVTEPQRTIHLDLEVQRAAMGHACSHHDRWTRGHLPKSAFPTPPKQDFGNRIMWHNAVEGVFLEEAYLDGSASHPANLGYSASACSIVSMDMLHGRPHLQLRVDVAMNDGIDGPEAAEISAVEYLLRFAILPLLAWSDCQNVVDAFQRGRSFCTSTEHPYCIYWRRVFTLLDDHAHPGGLTIRKIKAHCTIHNYAQYGMSHIQWCGNRHADVGAQSTALCMAKELNLQGYVDECTRIEKDHRGLCMWLARVTALVNRADYRDAIPAPDDYTGAARKKVPACKFGSKPCKRPRVVTTAAARISGNPKATKVVEIIPSGSYGQLREFDLVRELEAVMSDSSMSEGGDDPGFDLVGELEAIISDNEALDFGAAPEGFSDFEPADYSGIIFDGEGQAASSTPPPMSPTPPPVTRRRLTCKTSPGDAAGLGYGPPEPTVHQDDRLLEDSSSDSDESMKDEDIPTESTDVPLAVVDVHGGLFLQTDNILWCAKCGASAKLGWSSAYLRKACPGKPINESMKQRRKRLIRGKHPTTCKPLASSAKRVRII